MVVLNDQSYQLWSSLSSYAFLTGAINDPRDRSIQRIKTTAVRGNMWSACLVKQEKHPLFTAIFFQHCLLPSLRRQTQQRVQQNDNDNVYSQNLIQLILLLNRNIVLLCTKNRCNNMLKFHINLCRYSICCSSIRGKSSWRSFPQ